MISEEKQDGVKFRARDSSIYTQQNFLATFISCAKMLSGAEFKVTD